MNNVIKMKVDRKRSSIDDFCSKMKLLVQEQRDHLIRAITCRGEYRLHPFFKEFEVSPLKWFEFAECTRARHIKSLCDVAYKYMDKFQSSIGGDEFHDPDLPQSEELQDDPEPDLTLSDEIQNNPEPDLPLSEELQDNTEPDAEELQGNPEPDLPQAMQMEIAKHTFVPECTVKNIFTKAGDLLTDERAITAAPIHGEARMVKSVSNPCRPHLIKILKGGKVVCA